MLHLIRALDKTGGAGAVPLHHADVVGGAKNDGIAFGLIEEGRFSGKDFAGISGLLNVVNTAGAAAVPGLAVPDIASRRL